MVCVIFRRVCFFFFMSQSFPLFYRRKNNDYAESPSPESQHSSHSRPIWALFLSQCWLRGPSAEHLHEKERRIISQGNLKCNGKNGLLERPSQNRFHHHQLLSLFPLGLGQQAPVKSSWTPHVQNQPSSIRQPHSLNQPIQKPCQSPKIQMMNPSVSSLIFDKRRRFKACSVLPFFH